VHGFSEHEYGIAKRVHKSSKNVHESSERVHGLPEDVHERTKHGDKLARRLKQDARNENIMKSGQRNGQNPVDVILELRPEDDRGNLIICRKGPALPR
jgi:hypothetical protein